MWRLLLNQWIQQQVRDKVQQTVAEAAQGLSQPSSETPGEPPPPADVGLVFALGIESGGLIDCLDGVLTTKVPQVTFRHGGYRGRHVVVAEGGAGRPNAAHATELLIQAHQPAWVISAGFAGALDDSVRQHDLLLVNQVGSAEGETLSIDLRMPAEELVRNPTWKLGKLVTVDQVVRTPQDKRALGQQHAALAVDMETYAVAEVCRRHKTRFLAVRVISDGVDDVLPDEIERLTRQRTMAGQLGAAAAAIWNRPGSVKQMWQLKETAIVASDRLAKFLLGMIPQLAPRTDQLNSPPQQPAQNP
ncbi:MAG: 5'-methylthioadenosine nucleosidase [Planctomycetaceae bacterium]|nr:5'-methylthioadenosine nucleosidase [Planctomycetaceae bacterium]